MISQSPNITITQNLKLGNVDLISEFLVIENMKGYVKNEVTIVDLFTSENQNRLISDAKEYIAKLFEGHSDGHDLEHSMRVFSNAVTNRRRD